MDEKPVHLPLLQRREVEARIIGPLIAAVRGELGDARTLELLRGVITDLAREAGSALADELASTTLDAFAGALDRWKEGGALEIEMLEQSPRRLDFNVRRCRYAEMYRTLGLAELGPSLSCQRDFALIEGFNPSVRLTRTQTLMEGADYCNFRFEAPADDPPAEG